VAPQTPAGSVADPAILDTPLPENVLYFLESALASRERGDMKAALAQLRAAYDLLPDHPRLLYELATAYEKMALRAKAGEIWDRILKLGPGAGPFFKMAEIKFEDGLAREPREVQTALQLGKVLVRRDPNPAVQEQWTVRIPVQARDGAVIDPTRVHVDVIFFDQLAGKRIEPTSGDISPGRWLSGAPQWLATPVEFLELTCQHPKMPAVGANPTPERRIHGYVVKLYYSDQLQDVVAEPAQLANRAHEPGERSLENAVDRPVVDDPLFPLPVK
jgi:tetratricopeptide (TPR) repeat protein